MPGLSDLVGLKSTNQKSTIKNQKWKTEEILSKNCQPVRRQWQ